jgi:hypothetical protein
VTRPSRHNTDDNYIGIRIANGVALVVFLCALGLAGRWFYHTFLEAAPAITRSISANGGK